MAAQQIIPNQNQRVSQGQGQGQAQYPVTPRSNANVYDYGNGNANANNYSFAGNTETDAWQPDPTFAQDFDEHFPPQPDQDLSCSEPQAKNWEQEYKQFPEPEPVPAQRQDQAFMPVSQQTPVNTQSSNQNWGRNLSRSK